jgi:hypothetical protein
LQHGHGFDIRPTTSIIKLAYLILLGISVYLRYSLWIARTSFKRLHSWSKAAISCTKQLAFTFYKRTKGKIQTKTYSVDSDPPEMGGKLDTFKEGGL